MSFQVPLLISLLCKVLTQRLPAIELATNHQFPYFAHVEIRHEHTPAACGSSLIHPQWILSSASCFSPYEEELLGLEENNKLLVYVGSNHKCNSTAIKNLIKKITFHPEFQIVLNKTGSVKEITNNIAVSQLKMPYNTSELIKPAYLPQFISMQEISKVRCKLGTVIGVDETGPVTLSNYCPKVSYVQLAARTLDEFSDMIFHPSVESKFCSEWFPVKRIAFADDNGNPFVCDLLNYSVVFGILSMTFYTPPTGDTALAIYEEVDKHTNFILQVVPEAKVYRPTTSEVATNICLFRFYIYLSIIFLIIK